MKYMNEQNTLTTLWTIQDYSFYEKILQNQTIYPYYSDHIDRRCVHGYQWLIQQMNMRIGASSQYASCPIWAWYQWQSSTQKRPDLRYSGHLSKGSKAVRIEFQKKSHEILLSDFDLWHYPYSFKSYIPCSTADEIQFNEKLKNLGLEDTDFYQLPRDIKQEIKTSWQHCFDLNFDHTEYSRIAENKCIQATLWSLSIDEIVTVDEFIAR